jgi:hypothetical protein
MLHEDAESDEEPGSDSDSASEADSQLEDEEYHSDEEISESEDEKSPKQVIMQNPPYDDSSVKADIENIHRRIKSMYEYIDSNVSTLHRAINEHKLQV